MLQSENASMNSIHLFVSPLNTIKILEMQIKFKIYSYRDIAYCKKCIKLLHSHAIIYIIFLGNLRQAVMWNKLCVNLDDVSLSNEKKNHALLHISRFSMFWKQFNLSSKATFFFLFFTGQEIYCWNNFNSVCNKDTQNIRLDYNL